MSVIYRLLNNSVSERTILRIAALFHNLSFDGVCSDALRESGIITFFMEQLQSGNEAMTISCLYALNNLMCSNSSRQIVQRELSTISLNPLIRSRNPLIALTAQKLQNNQ